MQTLGVGHTSVAVREETQQSPQGRVLPPKHGEMDLYSLWRRLRVAGLLARSLSEGQSEDLHVPQAAEHCTCKMEISF